jgi:hypothetical protein
MPLGQGKSAHKRNATTRKRYLIGVMFSELAGPGEVIENATTPKEILDRPDALGAGRPWEVMKNATTPKDRRVSASVKLDLRAPRGVR